MPKNALDVYPQYAVLSVPGTAGVSGTNIQQLVTGLTNMQKVAWAVTRIEYDFPVAWLSQFGAGNKYLELGVTQNGSVAATLGLKGQSVIDNIRWCRAETPAAIGEVTLELPFIHDFPPGNERLVLPQNIYAYLGWVSSANLTAANADIRVWYREVELTSQDWYDLLQLRLPLGSI
jgi:hypothetical protein